MRTPVTNTWNVDLGSLQSGLGGITFPLSFEGSALLIPYITYEK